ncbi:MAG: aldo/keto reductase [Bacteroidota bacterium]
MKSNTLNNGIEMPSVGLGVWRTEDGQQVITAIHHALEVGYRHVDTAMIYKNENGVGEALQTTNVPRDQVFLTTKVWNTDIRAGRAAQAIDESLTRLKTDYADLILLHWPTEGYEAAWEALEKALEVGKVRAIGLSNFMPNNLADILRVGSTVPAVNQIELHPYLQQHDVQAACAEHNIAITAWSPLMQGKFLEEPLFVELADKYGKTAAQVLLRWDLERNFITIPKSTNPGRIQQIIDSLHIFCT